MSELPSLQPLGTTWGSPNPGCRQSMATGIIHDRRLTLLATLDHVCILDERMRITDTLLLSDGYPASLGKGWLVSAVTMDSANSIIAAASGDNIVMWTCSQPSGTWKIHSTFKAGHAVGWMNVQNNTMVLGGERLSLWHLDQSRSLPEWTKTWEYKFESETTRCIISPCGTLLASLQDGSSAVQIWRILPNTAIASSSKAFAPTLVSEIFHPDVVASFEWKPDPIPANATLFTQTVSGIYRIYSTLLDEPDFFVLSATVSHPYRKARPAVSFWLDHTDVQGTQALSNQAHDGPIESTDRVLIVFDDGTVGVVEVFNLSRSPPTCISQKSTFTHTNHGITSALAGRLSSSLNSMCSLSPKHPLMQGLSTIAICAANAHTATVDTILLPLETLFKQTSIKARCRTYRGQPVNKIERCVPSADGRFIATASKKEIVLWQARQASGQVLTIEAVARTLRNATLAVPFSVSGVVGVIALDTKHQLRLYRRQGRKLSVVQMIACSQDVTDFSIGSDQVVGDHKLLAILRNGGLQSWQIDGHLTAMPIDVSLPSRDTHTEIPDKNSFNLTCTGAGSLTIWPATSPGHWTRSRRLEHGVDTPLICSLGPKGLVAIVCKDATSGLELSIWDSHESEFASGLQARVPILSDEAPIDIAWNTANAGQVMLAVALASQVFIYMQRRRDYLAQDCATWIAVGQLPATEFKRHRITGLSWLSDGTLVVSAANKLYSFAPLLANESQQSLSRVYRSLNGPVPIYHPQFLLQCLLWNRTALVNRITVALCGLTSHRSDEWSSRLKDWPEADLLQNATTVAPSSPSDDLFADSFSQDVTADQLSRLFETLDKGMLADLSSTQVAHLKSIIQIAREVTDQKRSLDDNGMRYLVSLRCLYAATERPPPNIKSSTSLSHRDFLWAFESESQEVLVQECMKACKEKMSWDDAKSLGLFLWLKSSDALASQMEIIARHAFTANEERNPISCSVFYLALKKKRLVQNIWKQSYGHKDRNNMINFLANDFSEARWRTAALKNAYALLSKQRFEFAVGFFLLGDSLKDAVNVCVKQLNDIQLAIALARVYAGEDGPIFTYLIEEHVLPQAIAKGDRWLTSWAFWMNHRRDLALRVLISPFSQIVDKLSSKSLSVIGTAQNDDPALILAYVYLRDWSLQTLQGASKISPQTEFNFVLYMASVLRDLGCHWLALDLTSNWKFTKTQSKKPLINSEAGTRHLPANRRRQSMLGRRDSLIVMDLDTIPSAEPSRAPSPSMNGTTAQKQSYDEDLTQVMKKAKKQVTHVPDFDMGSFGF